MILKNNPILSQKIRYYRNLKNMTQEELAQEIGVEPLHISCVERGSKGLRLSKLELLCKCFNITMADLLPVDTQEDPEEKIMWIDEIVDTLETLEPSQVGMLKTMVRSLRR